MDLNMTVTLTVVRNEGLSRQRIAATANDSAQPFYSEYAINPREVFRAEVCTINGRAVVRLSRWKRTPEGHKRIGFVFEFGAHRCQGVVKMLSDIERELGGLSHAAT
jgi:hypothetical protein